MQEFTPTQQSQVCSQRTNLKKRKHSFYRKPKLILIIGEILLGHTTVKSSTSARNQCLDEQNRSSRDSPPPLCWLPAPASFAQQWQEEDWSSMGLWDCECPELTVHLVRVGWLSCCWRAETGAIAEKSTLSWRVAQAVLRFNAFGVHRGNQEQNVSACHVKM